jgi:hypothetical protein
MTSFIFGRVTRDLAGCPRIYLSNILRRFGSAIGCAGNENRCYEPHSGLCYHLFVPPFHGLARKAAILPANMHSLVGLDFNIYTEYMHMVAMKRRRTLGALDREPLEAVIAVLFVHGRLLKHWLLCVQIVVEPEALSSPGACSLLDRFLIASLPRQPFR